MCNLNATHCRAIGFAERPLSLYMCTLLFRAALPAADGKNANNLYLNALQFARADRRLQREGGAGAEVGGRVW